MNTQLIIPLDFRDIIQAKYLIEELGDLVTWYKVGKQMFTRYGPPIIQYLKSKKKKVFLDLKFHDIPNTVAMAINSSIDLGVDMTNVHAVGGSDMMTAALKIKQERESTIVLIAVTVLTSMSESNLNEIGCGGMDIAEQVKKLAILTKKSGLDGVVASAHELSLISDNCGPEFIKIIPGIRPEGFSNDDQKRIMTPEEASRKGAQFIVVGRPITQSKTPITVVTSILDEIKKSSSKISGL